MVIHWNENVALIPTVFSSCASRAWGLPKSIADREIITPFILVHDLGGVGGGGYPLCNSEQD